jgi:chitin disaccharide deacetylase
VIEPNKIYLITKADDIGSNNSANRAFCDGYKKGILRNGVIMMNCASAKEAAEMFKDEKGFCMGLHLTMNAEWDSVKWGPVLPKEQVPTLVDEHGFLFQSTKSLYENSPRLEEFLAEAQAQLDLARHYGLDIKFADCHMFFPWVLEGLEGEIEKWCHRNGLLYYKGGFRELPRVEVSGDPVEELIERLKAAEPGVYYIHMGHPAYDSAEMRRLGHQGYTGDRVAEEREWDRLTLMDERIVEFCRDNNVVPVTLEEAMKLAEK